MATLSENNEMKLFLRSIVNSLETIADSLSEKRKGVNPDKAFDEKIVEVKKLGVENIGSDEKRDETKTNSIKEFLRTKNIKIKKIPAEDKADSVINSLSDFLGVNYAGLRELLAKIKRSMQNGGGVTLSLKEYAQKDMNNICLFSKKLHEITFLEQYRYFKSPKYLIKAKTTTLPAAQKFFSGQWLERFVLLTAKKAVNLASNKLNQKLEFSYLLNPQVILPNGDNFELDLIFHVNGVFYWIEAKSGDYQQHISKYSKVSKMLNLDDQHSIMELTDIAPEKSVALASLFSMTVTSLSQLESMLVNRIEKDQSVN